jgi:alkylation response protein AidB-like acyl-CoA dehydrogenase
LPDLVGCNPSGTKKQVHIIPARKDWLSIAEAIAARLRETAVAREHAAVPPLLEISWLRDADLLTLLNPAQAGGGAAAFSDAFRVVRRLARADTSIAQSLSYHYLLSHSALWRATEEQRSRLVRQSVEQKWF